MAEESFAELLQAAQNALQEKSYERAEALFIRLDVCRRDRPDGLIGQAHVAQLRDNWADALQLWDRCLDRHREGQRSAWLRAKGWALAQLGKYDEAEALVRSLADAHPDDPASLKALAGIFMVGKRWREALELWDHLLQHFSGHQEIGWLIGRANCLDQSGEPEQAQAAFLEAWKQSGNVYAAWRYLQSLGRANPPDEALAEIVRGRFKDHGSYEIALLGAQYALRCDDMEHIRQVLPRLIKDASTSIDLTAILQLIPASLDGRERYEAWIRLEQRAASLRDGGDKTELQAIHVVAARIKLALRDYAGFLTFVDKDNIDPQWKDGFARLAHALRANEFPDYDAEKIFGIGLSKTGTSSLAKALGELGYLTAHYFNVFTFELLTPEDAYFFDALTDTSICPDFEALFYLFPNSKFIYTTRPTQDWLDSFERHDRRYMRSTDLRILRRRVTTPGLTRYGTSLARSAVSIFYRHPDRETARLRFEERVHAFFAGPRAARLLVLDIFSGDGWDKLCGFLGQPVPDKPFPWENQDAR